MSTQGSVVELGVNQVGKINPLGSSNSGAMVEPVCLHACPQGSFIFTYVDEWGPPECREQLSSCSVLQRPRPRAVKGGTASVQPLISSLIIPKTS